MEEGRITGSLDFLPTLKYSFSVMFLWGCVKPIHLLENVWPIIMGIYKHSYPNSCQGKIKKFKSLKIPFWGFLVHWEAFSFVLGMMERLFFSFNPWWRWCTPFILGFVLVLHAGQKAALGLDSSQAEWSCPTNLGVLICPVPGGPWVFSFHIPGTLGLAGISPKSAVWFSPVAGC